jgi:flagellar basal body-associated protein FliL
MSNLDDKRAARRKEGEMIVAIILVVVVVVVLAIAIAGFNSTVQVGRDALHGALGSP